MLTCTCDSLIVVLNWKSSVDVVVTGFVQKERTMNGFKNYSASLCRLYVQY